MVNALSAVKTRVSMEEKLSEFEHSNSPSDEDTPHSTHVPTNLLAGRVSVSTTGGVGGSGSGSGRWQAANIAKTAITAMHNTQRQLSLVFSVCVLFLFIVLLF
jgi:hypothetical protein